MFIERERKFEFLNHLQSYMFIHYLFIFFGVEDIVLFREPLKIRIVL